MRRHNGDIVLDKIFMVMDYSEVWV